MVSVNAPNFFTLVRKKPNHGGEKNEATFFSDVRKKRYKGVEIAYGRHYEVIFLGLRDLRYKISKRRWGYLTIAKEEALNVTIYCITLVNGAGDRSLKCRNF